jgi:amino acid adenylation domain-containing protein
LTEQRLDALLAASAARHPERIAVLDGARSVTYRELDAAANRLAQTLRRRGVRAGDRVGIALEKSIEAVTAIHGILRAGAAYVPVDPRAPAARAAFLVGDCAMQGLVTTADRLARLRPALERAPPCLVLVDAEAPEGAAGRAELAGSPAAPPAGADAAGAADLAYILYTSGSTGEPKGVMLSHRAGLSFVRWAAELFALRAGDRLASHAPLHFDLSILDLFGAAAAGASVALVPPGVAVFPRSLADWIEKSAISVWYSVPSALTQLALNGGLERHRYEALRLVLFAGEVFPVRHLRRLMTLLPRARHANLYGPTETNVCTWQEAALPPEGATEPLPIGRACANCEVFALDDAGAVVGAGGTGELYVCGPSLMAGYWGRPAQTQAVLVPDPRVPGGGGAPAYRTGDLARLDADGRWHYLGRRDAQVKSRGYRIELGDVEAALYRHPGVEEAAVLAQPHEEFGCTLRAVVVPRAGQALEAAQLAAHCAAELPPYMLPAAFELRAAPLPRTSSGKVDRRAL